MKVKEAGSKYFPQSVGHYAFCINTDSGVDINVDELVEQAKFFNLIIIHGIEPFEQKEEIVKLTKKIAKENTTVKFRIYTTGTIKPSLMIENIDYWVNIQLKGTGIQYSKRINPNAIEWYIQSNANFVFFINTDDDKDEVDLLINNFGIPKHKVFLGIRHIDNYEFELKQLIKYTKLKGYNYFFNTQQVIHYDE